MTADSQDNYNYESASEYISEEQRRHYWAVAMGLQAVDNLTVSSYVCERADAYISGEKTLAETGQLIRSYHSHNNASEHAEADLVSQRIVELLARATFYLAPELLSHIHAYLFQDMDKNVYHPGEFKSERMIKQEEVLNGDSVLYADPLVYNMSLAGAFSAEAAKMYTTFTEEEIKGFCHTVAFLWQVHPFYEGNTRTIAVFSELYLNFLGFRVTNEPFEKHAKYYRNALVRAIYRNAPAGIFPNESFLVTFYKNALNLSQQDLNDSELMCPALFESPTLLRNIDPSKALHW